MFYFPGLMVIIVFACTQILGRVTSDIPNTDTSNATSEPNTPKNRYQDKIPCKEIANLLSR